MEQFDGKFNVEHLQIIAEGIRLFNAQKYWECHEELEDHWREEPGPVRLIYWAIIQVAAAMIHYREGNLIGARGLIAKAKQKFDKAEVGKVEGPLLEEYLSWAYLKKLTRSVPVESRLEDFKQLYSFRFKDPDTWKK